jgi:disulfide bond formation protein DsbB
VSFPRILRPLRLVAASLLALVSLTLLASAASAQETCTTPQPYGDTVCGTVTVPDTAPPETTAPTVLGRTQTRFGVTGGDMVGIAAIGGGAVAVGTALVLAARRRRMAELV